MARGSRVVVNVDKSQVNRHRQLRRKINIITVDQHEEPSLASVTVTRSSAVSIDNNINSTLTSRVTGTSHGVTGFVSPFTAIQSEITSLSLETPISSSKTESIANTTITPQTVLSSQDDITNTKFVSIPGSQNSSALAIASNSLRMSQNGTRETAQPLYSAARDTEVPSSVSYVTTVTIRLGDSPSAQALLSAAAVPQFLEHQSPVEAQAGTPDERSSGEQVTVYHTISILPSMYMPFIGGGVIHTPLYSSDVDEGSSIPPSSRWATSSFRGTSSPPLTSSRADSVRSSFSSNAAVPGTSSKTAPTSKALSKAYESQSPNEIQNTITNAATGTGKSASQQVPTSSFGDSSLQHSFTDDKPSQSWPLTDSSISTDSSKTKIPILAVLNSTPDAPSNSASQYAPSTYVSTTETDSSFISTSQYTPSTYASTTEADLATKSTSQYVPSAYASTTRADSSLSASADTSETKIPILAVVNSAPDAPSISASQYAPSTYVSTTETDASPTSTSQYAPSTGTMETDTSPLSSTGAPSSYLSSTVPSDGASVSQTMAVPTNQSPNSSEFLDLESPLSSESSDTLIDNSSFSETTQKPTVSQHSSKTSETGSSATSGASSSAAAGTRVNGSSFEASSLASSAIVSSSRGAVSSSPNSVVPTGVAGGATSSSERSNSHESSLSEPTTGTDASSKIGYSSGSRSESQKSSGSSASASSGVHIASTTNSSAPTKSKTETKTNSSSGKTRSASSDALKGSKTSRKSMTSTAASTKSSKSSKSSRSKSITTPLPSDILSTLDSTSLRSLVSKSHETGSRTAQHPGAGGIDYSMLTSLMGPTGSSEPTQGGSIDQNKAAESQATTKKIVGGVVGSIACAAVLAFIAFYLLAKKRNQKQPIMEDATTIPPAETDEPGSGLYDGFGYLHLAHNDMSTDTQLAMAMPVGALGVYSVSSAATDERTSLSTDPFAGIPSPSGFIPRVISLYGDGGTSYGFDGPTNMTMREDVPFSFEENVPTLLDNQLLVGGSLAAAGLAARHNNHDSRSRSTDEDWAASMDSSDKLPPAPIGRHLPDGLANSPSSGHRYGQNGSPSGIVKSNKAIVTGAAGNPDAAYIVASSKGRAFHDDATSSGSWRLSESEDERSKYGWKYSSLGGEGAGLAISNAFGPRNGSRRDDDGQQEVNEKSALESADHSSDAKLGVLGRIKQWFAPSSARDDSMAAAARAHDQQRMSMNDLYFIDASDSGRDRQDTLYALATGEDSIYQPGGTATRQSVSSSSAFSSSSLLRTGYGNSMSESRNMWTRSSYRSFRGPRNSASGGIQQQPRRSRLLTSLTRYLVETRSPSQSRFIENGLED